MLQRDRAPVPQPQLASPRCGAFTILALLLQGILIAPLLRRYCSTTGASTLPVSPGTWLVGDGYSQRSCIAFELWGNSAMCLSVGCIAL